MVAAVGCDPNPRECQSQRDCFGGESCVAGECIAVPMINNGIADTGNPDTNREDVGSDCRLNEAVCGGFVCNVSTGMCERCQRDIQCGDGGLCDQVNGECTCDPDFHACGGTCVRRDSPDACGDSCEPCPGAENATPTCDGTSCGLACADGFERCEDCALECIECRGNSDCDNAGESRCVGNLCEQCAVDDDCSHIDGLPVCHEGRCVQCTTPKTLECGNNSCDPARNICTNTPKQSLDWCEACVADSECPPNHRCAPMFFKGSQRANAYCLQVANDTCTQPDPLTVQRDSLSGIIDEYFCVFREDLTTCEAQRDFERPCSQDSQCGTPGLGDGLCKAVGGPEICTFPCVSLDDCPGGTTCIGNPPDNSYCGDV